MALIKCPDCGKEVSDAAPSCIQCGRPMLPATSSPAVSAEPAQGLPPTGPSASTSRYSSTTTRSAPASPLRDPLSRLATFLESLEPKWRELPRQKKVRLGAFLAAAMVVVAIVGGLADEANRRTTAEGLGGSSEASAPGQPSEDAQRRQFIVEVRARLALTNVSDDISVEARGDGSRTIRYRIGPADFRAGMPVASDAVRVLVNAEGPLEKATIQALGFQVIEFEDGKGLVRRFRIADIVPR